MRYKACFVFLKGPSWLPIDAQATDCSSDECANLDWLPFVSGHLAAVYGQISGAPFDVRKLPCLNEVWYLKLVKVKVYQISLFRDITGFFSNNLNYYI